MASKNPIEVAVIGGGCASIAAALELTRPEHEKKYHVTIYQLGWRLGGKGASGRGPADRIEEHGLHVWMGWYENAFRLLRETYAELARDPQEYRIAHWRDAFSPDSFAGVADLMRDGQWRTWMAHIPPAEGVPGDPLTDSNSFSVGTYLRRSAALLRVLLVGLQRQQDPETRPRGEGDAASLDSLQGADPQGENTAFDVIMERVTQFLDYGLLYTTAGLIQTVKFLEIMFRALPTYPENVVLRLLETIASKARQQLETLVVQDDEVRYKWEIIDLIVATLIGILRFGLTHHPRGFDEIDNFELKEWLRANGASERSLNSAFLRGLYALPFAYQGPDRKGSGIAAGQALRGAFRTFFTYRGAIFWKMQGGMGDVVFAPMYEVLKRRGVTFKFFHRLENVKMSEPADLAPGERPYVTALEFDIQANVNSGRDYQPLVDVRGEPCWPSTPDYSQLVDGIRLESEGWDFESHWDRRKADTLTLRVIDDFDFAILGVSIGAIPFVCKEVVARDPRWRAMVEHVKTVPTQAFQLWMRESMQELGRTHPPINVVGFTQPFDSWADMQQLIPEESWIERPRAIAYFCSALPDSVPPDRSDVSYPARRHEDVRRNAIRFLNEDIQHLWPEAVRASGQFRWELLVDPAESSIADTDGDGESRFESQYWTANVNPTDRYVLSLPGSLQYRISPLDNTYDNLTITGDWTDCGFNAGCVEAAIMSGRLAAHAISRLPALKEIIGYDHP